MCSSESYLSSLDVQIVDLTVEDIRFPTSLGNTSGMKRDKTMAIKYIYIPNDDTQNYPFCRLKLEVETFEHLI